MLMMLLLDWIEVPFSATKVSSDFPKLDHIRIAKVPSCGVMRGVVFFVFFAEEKFPTLK